MTPSEFIEKAGNPKAWHAKATALRRSADAVWEVFSHRLMNSIDSDTRSIDDEKLDEAKDVLRNCQFLYSLAAECALKGLVIKQNPTEVTFDAIVDGTGSLVDAKIKRIGKNRIDTHNLESLAEIAGMVAKGGDAEIRELLSFSTFCINWIGRYPVPLEASTDFLPRDKLPGVVFNHYYRDLMDPFLDDVLGKLNR
tara:strand:+ start:27936 stop:28523 length:588 start_codon:yes stop_codon:yes gene_type:complete